MNNPKPSKTRQGTDLFPQNFTASTPRKNTFSLDLILKQTPKSKSRKFKFLFKPEHPTHRRQPSVIIKNLTDIYSFESDPLSDQSIDEELRASPKKSIIRADTGSVLTTAFQKSSIEGDRLDYECSNLVDLANGTTKPDEFEDLEDLDFGILPSLMYCGKCGDQVMTDVKIRLPTLPFWKTVCCLSSLFDLSNSAEKFQQFEHSCVKCRTVLAIKSPNI